MYLAKPLSTIQKALPSLTLPFSNLISWLFSTHTPWTHHTACTLFFASIFFLPRELLLTFKIQFKHFQSISWLLLAKQAVLRTFVAPAPFLLCFCIFTGITCLNVSFYSKILWLLSEDRLYLPHLFIPKHLPSYLVPGRWENLSA